MIRKDLTGIMLALRRAEGLGTKVPDRLPHVSRNWPPILKRRHTGKRTGHGSTREPANRQAL